MNSHFVVTLICYIYSIVSYVLRYIYSLVLLFFVSSEIFKMILMSSDGVSFEADNILVAKSMLLQMFLKNEKPSVDVVIEFKELHSLTLSFIVQYCSEPSSDMLRDQTKSNLILVRISFSVFFLPFLYLFILRFF